MITDVSLGLLYLIVDRFLSWLILLGRATSSKDVGLSDPLAGAACDTPGMIPVRHASPALSDLQPAPELADAARSRNVIYEDIELLVLRHKAAVLRTTNPRPRLDWADQNPVRRADPTPPGAAARSPPGHPVTIWVGRQGEMQMLAPTVCG